MGESKSGWLCDVTGLYMTWNCVEYDIEGDGHSVIKLIVDGSFSIDVEILNDVQHSTFSRCM
jgi:hypothetical protein